MLQHFLRVILLIKTKTLPRPEVLSPKPDQGRPEREHNPLKTKTEESVRINKPWALALIFEEKHHIETCERGHSSQEEKR